MTPFLPTHKAPYGSMRSITSHNSPPDGVQHGLRSISKVINSLYTRDFRSLADPHKHKPKKRLPADLFPLRASAPSRESLPPTCQTPFQTTPALTPTPPSPLNKRTHNHHHTRKHRMSTTKRRAELTVHDKLSRLTFTQTCKLLGAEGASPSKASAK